MDFFVATFTLIFLLMGVISFLLSFRYKWHYESISYYSFFVASVSILGSFFVDTLSNITNEYSNKHNILIYIVYLAILIVLVRALKNTKSKAIKQQTIFVLFISNLLTICLMNVISYYYVEVITDFKVTSIDTDSLINFNNSRLTFIGLFFTLFVASFQLKDEDGENTLDSIADRLSHIESRLDELDHQDNTKIQNSLNSIENSIKDLAKKSTSEKNTISSILKWIIDLLQSKKRT